MQEMAEKVLTHGASENLEEEQLHPKIFQTFSRQYASVPLQKDACPNFAKEKSRERGKAGLNGK